MVEIFTQGRGAGETAVRTTGSETRLSRPADVHFGAGAPGIAYFEKAGADLKVTLLDGTEVLVKDFFVIGEAGEFSRLLDSAGGEVQVTGLIAPEPFQPRSDAPPAMAQGDAVTTTEELLPAGVDAPQTIAAGADPGVTIDPKSPTSIEGMPLDMAVFGGAMLAPVAVMASGGKSSKGGAADPEPAATAARTDATQTDEVLTEELPTGELPADAESPPEAMEADVAALLSGIFAPDAEPNTDPGSTAQTGFGLGPDFGMTDTDLHAQPLADFSFDQLFDALTAAGTQTP